MAQKPPQEYIDLPFPYAFPYRWATGPVMGRFLKELRDNKRIMATRCPQCGRVSLPPNFVCGRCHGVYMGDNWVEVSDKGTLRGFIKIVEPIWNPSEGRLRTEPFMQGDIALDGVEGATVSHFLEEQDPEKLKVGMRVQAVWKEREERVGDLSDIKYFKLIKE